MSNLAERLQTTLFALKISKGDFADKGGVRAATVTGYIKGETLPNQETLANWVKAYNLNAHWLLTGEGEMLADHQNPPLQHPLAQRVNQVALVMSDSGVDDMELLRAVRAMVDGEMDKLDKLRGGSGAAETTAGQSRAAEETSPSPVRKKAVGDDSV